MRIQTAPDRTDHRTMPKPLVDPPLDAIRVLHRQGVTGCVIAKRCGISRSFTYWRLARIGAATVTPERVAAGVDPLRAGHQLSWRAISALPSI